MKKRIVKHKVLIEAPIAKVWEVLIAPKFIRQWDSLPEDFADYYLEVGREIEWAGSSKLTVTEMIAHERIKMSLYVYRWELPPSAYDIGYTYSISPDGENTQLSIEIGDFGVLENGEEYYNASEEFAEKSLKKIKALAENRG